MALLYKVEIEGNSGFILDVDRLDVGVLGYLSTDITSYVRSVSTNRGKSSSLDEFTAGKMTVVFDNRTRVFDPQNTASPLYGSIVPRRKLRFYAGKSSADIESQFVGFIDDWSFQYDVAGDSTATASASDAFTILATQNITLTTPPSENAVERVRRVLANSQVAWTEGFFSDGSPFTAGTASYIGNALSYIQSIIASERGYFYVTQSGDLRYDGWNHFSYSTPYGLPIGDQLDGNHIPFVSIETTYDTDQLYNYVTVQSYGGTVISQNVSSQQVYRIASETFDVTTAGTAQMQVLADYLISNYSTPRFRVESVTIAMDDPRIDPVWGDGITTVLQHDIGGNIALTWTPNGVGSAVSLTGYIIGKKIQATPNDCTITFSISGDDTRNVYYG